MVTDWTTDIQFPEWKPGDDKAEREVTYTSQFRVEATRENKGN